MEDLDIKVENQVPITVAVRDIAAMLIRKNTDALI
jgi:hypothetical protein